MSPDLPARRGESHVPGRSGATLRSRASPGSGRTAVRPPPIIPPQDRPPVPPDRQAAPALAEAPERQDHLEAVIRIIMDATGFNRDEIQPDMDLRRDLSVRSSRLPIIMDAAERHFGITIELEDFLHVRTVRDIAGGSPRSSPGRKAPANGTPPRRLTPARRRPESRRRQRMRRL